MIILHEWNFYRKEDSIKVLRWSRPRTVLRIPFKGFCQENCMNSANCPSGLVSRGRSFKTKIQSCAFEIRWRRLAIYVECNFFFSFVISWSEKKARLPLQRIDEQQMFSKLLPERAHYSVRQLNAAVRGLLCICAGKPLSGWKKSHFSAQ